MTAPHILLISRRLYRWHRLYPDHLPGVLHRASRMVTGQDTPWEVTEEQHYDLIDPLDSDFRLAEELPFTTALMLQGVVYAAVVSLVQQVKNDGGVP